MSRTPDMCNRCAGMLHCGTQIVRHEGVLALYKGLAPTLLGIAPYAALNFALYDIAKKACYSGEKPQHPVANLALGGITGTVAATVCYPLDTVRRRMQMKGKTYNGQLDAMRSILQKVSQLYSLVSFAQPLSRHRVSTISSARIGTPAK